ncbi:unnamed protein product [Spirodela intermedia]|uniref:Uncharacterized protein n=1 Tax=Spirodela intermedia TaxID=51605 RepID=A0A7I8IRB5_SPIIN|nr:unnamed protein product [Spirodela intermedia]CAA6660312.1 unnamed protein product [Spirodela intermedia]
MLLDSSLMLIPVYGITLLQTFYLMLSPSFIYFL